MWIVLADCEKHQQLANTVSLNTTAGEIWEGPHLRQSTQDASDNVLLNKVVGSTMETTHALQVGMNAECWG